LFLGLRVSVFRRAAFNHVCYVNIFIARKVNRCQEFIKQLPASAHEWLALQILVFAGAFADKHNISILFALAENHICSVLAQAAFAAAFALKFKLVKSQFNHRVSKIIGRIARILFSISQLRAPNKFFAEFTIEKRTKEV
jgi:hypothetical protein